MFRTERPAGLDDAQWSNLAAILDPNGGDPPDAGEFGRAFPARKQGLAIADLTKTAFL